jgi:hypothetical protein
MKHVWAVILVAGTAQAGPAKPPHGATKISIDYTWQSFSHDERHYTLAWDGTRYVSDKKKPIDGALVDALYAALGNTHETAGRLQCISHTDDYPAFVITIEGDEPLTITSSSNCHAYVPWMIEKAGKLSVQFTGDAWRGLAPILAGLDGTWQANEPAATMSYGAEKVRLGHYEPGGTSTGDAAKCAHSFEIDPQAKQLFGEIHVEEAALACDLNASTDCTSEVVGAKFVFDGLDAQLEFACTGGVASLTPPQVKAYAELKRFTSSKVVRADVKVSKGRPRLWKDGRWNVESQSDGVPFLEWSPPDTTIAARDSGSTKPNAAFWSELGLAPKPYAKVPVGYTQLEVTLDFGGHVVK